MSIKLGDIYWIRPESDTDIAHPHIIIEVIESGQDSEPAQMLACALTTNSRKISVPGNILLEVGEGDLPKQSIVEVSKTLTVNADQLGEYIGTLPEKRIQQIQSNRQFLQTSYFRRSDS